MEQYWMPKELDFENLRLCLDNYQTDRILIRDCGGYKSDGSFRMYGLKKVYENLENKALDFRKDSSGLYLLIDSDEIFHFPLKDYDKGFSLAYERFFEDGRMYIPGGVADNPYNPNLPEPSRSFLRTVLDNHQMEIFFKGRIDIKFHSWWKKPDFKYWTIDVRKESEKT